ncbi:(2E,6E)-farnesyl diphosphate synthase [hydrothermal vent metagenome]|uniref:(2E,6E)-farnesyl diphosphate synthase n=1 Tax=hydrothermal vent metagenome TaxID=652676 RepID=A0A3B0W779_9ZZZZ
MDIKSYLTAKRTLVEEALNSILPESDERLTTHFEALNYSLRAGGKRIRPILCMAAAEALGGSVASFMDIPCALECIHTYSLIHDDLPAMDDDELRRGKPTNHMVYGEAEAILAGDGLLTLAFELLSRDNAALLSADVQLKITNLIARAAGSTGMVGGQALDIESEDKEIPFSTLRLIHSCKTGALITASVQSGALLGGAGEGEFLAMTSYGRNIGLAFQIVDDLLNVLGTTEQLGKAAGSDAEHNKATYPAIFGLEATREKAGEAVAAALEALRHFDHKADPLRALAEYIYTRSN